MQSYKEIHLSYRNGVIICCFFFYFGISHSILLELKSFMLDVNITHKKGCNEFKLGYVFSSFDHVLRNYEMWSNGLFLI